MSLYTVTFQWPYGGEKVMLAGSFTNWSPKYALEYDDEADSLITKIRLSPGTHQYKFIVNGRWCYDAAKPTVSDSKGNINNEINTESDCEVDVDPPSSPTLNTRLTPSPVCDLAPFNPFSSSNAYVAETTSTRIFSRKSCGHQYECREFPSLDTVEHGHERSRQTSTASYESWNNAASTAPYESWNNAAWACRRAASPYAEYLETAMRNEPSQQCCLLLNVAPSERFDR